jgi:hypothetical protein
VRAARAAAVLLVLGGFYYWSYRVLLGSFFAYDDFAWMNDAARIHLGSPADFRQFFETSNFLLYRPVTMLYFYLLQHTSASIRRAIRPPSSPSTSRMPSSSTRSRAACSARDGSGSRRRSRTRRRPGTRSRCAGWASVEPAPGRVVVSGPLTFPESAGVPAWRRLIRPCP